MTPARLPDPLLTDCRRIFLRGPLDADDFKLWPVIQLGLAYRF